MLSTIKRFAANESGAVTVDWMMLTGGVAALAFTLMGVIGGGLAGIDGVLSAKLDAGIDAGAASVFAGEANVVAELAPGLVRIVPENVQN